jgi:Flp pilus assembly pilin Flp
MILKRGSRKSQKGQGLTEYAIIIALVAIVCVIILGLVGLAVNRNYGLVAGALGAKKEIRSAQYYVYFDNNPPQCGFIGGTSTRGFYAQFFSDILNPNEFTIATDTGFVPTLIDNSGGGPGIGNWKIQMPLPDGMPCPTSLVIQTPKAKGGDTVAYTVLQKDFPAPPP